MRLLLAEDTRDVAEAIVASLARNGIAADHAATLADARACLQVQSYDLAILDINMPDGDGTALLREMRRQGIATPVLMLTAEFEVERRVAALDLGADDYLVKPFDLRELEARIRALARRDGSERSPEITLGRLSFNPAGRSVSIAGRPVSMTRREMSLLQIFLADRGKVVAKERLFERMFSFDDSEVGLNAVELYVARLRKKLAGSGIAIRTLRGLGYQLVEEE